MLPDFNTSTVTLVSVFTSLGVLVFGGITAFAKAIWWLAEEFKDVRRYVRDIYDAHEAKDQNRHEDNLVRFTSIDTKLDTVISNGHNS